MCGLGWERWVVLSPTVEVADWMMLCCAAGGLLKKKKQIFCQVFELLWKLAGNSDTCTGTSVCTVRRYRYGIDTQVHVQVFLKSLRTNFTYRIPVHLNFFYTHF